jgi:hypothetical protein
MARRKHDVPLLEKTNAGSRSTMGRCGAASNLNKDGGTVWRAHDQVDLATATPGGSIIARQQHQAVSAQMAQGLVFGGIARLLGAAAGLRRL